MATVVQHEDTGERFILIGSGLGISATARSSLLFGELLPAEEESVTTALAVCDDTGAIRWIRSSSLTVVSVDGMPPAQLLRSR